MPPVVRLEILNGPLQGQTFAIAERSRWILGRGPDCSLVIPDSQTSISRHHCILEISPPHVSVRDLGSLNGTYINQNCIGRRERGTSPDVGARLQLPDCELKHGDELQLGKWVDSTGPHANADHDLRLRIQLFAPARCATCHAELPGVNAFESTASQSQCARCQQKVRVPIVRPLHRCVVCGDERNAAPGESMDAKMPCARCRLDPDALIRHLRAQKEVETGLGAIRDYDLLQQIGRGGFGSVFLARQRSTNRRVALKAMLPAIAADAEARRRFEREIENTRSLAHPNVVSLFESGLADGVYFFTMDYCGAGNVSDVMARRGGVLPVEEALFLILQALDGLHYAHHATIPRVRLADGSYGPGVGLVHRDIKPCNLLLHGAGKSRVVKVSDYGLAKAFDKAGLSGVTQSGTFAGSIPFMARQQVLDFGASGPEVDVWAAAATLYFMLTSTTPRDFGPGVDPIKVVLQQMALPILQRNPNLPKRLAAVIDEALIDEPTLAIPDIATLQRRLREAC